MSRTKTVGKLETQDFEPDILRVSVQPRACSKEHCRNRGANLEFIVHFLARRIIVQDHWLEIGIQGGALALDLDPLIADKITPDPEMASIVRQRITNESSSEGEANTEKLALSHKKTKSTSSESDFLQVKYGGVPSKPYWIFQQPIKGVPLQGRSTPLSLHLSPQKRLPCKHRYEFVTTRSDWCFSVTPSSHVPILRRYFVRLALMSWCRKYLDDCFTKKLSCGQWKCALKAK
jgi:hypothetical protein